LGLGRAVLFLQTNDSAPYRDDILSTCLHNDVYDNQVNGSRPEYLFDIVRASTDEYYIRTRLIEAMAHLEDGGDGWMVSILMRMFAQEGDQEAREALINSIERDPTEDHPALGQMIELDGLAGLVFVAECLGDRGSSDPGYSDNDALLADAIDRFGEDIVWQTLDARSGASSQVSLFTNLARERREWRASNPRPERTRASDLGFEQFRSLIDDASMSRYFPQGWGLAASDSDLRLAAEELTKLSEDDTYRLVRYLRIFRLRPFPLSHSVLIRLWTNGNEEVRYGAVAALSKLQHPDVRQLGLQLTKSDDPRLRGLALNLIYTDPQPDDHVVMEAIIDRETDENALHQIGMSVLGAADLCQSNGPTDALLKVYERGPCAFCRESVVKRLIELDALPRSIADECLFDQNLETREMTREYLARTNQTSPLPELGEGAGGEG
jgi:hypothetical protein